MVQPVPLGVADCRGDHGIESGAGGPACQVAAPIVAFRPAAADMGRSDQPPGLEAIDRLLEALPLDEPHGVEGPALGIATQAVDRHDARVFEPPSISASSTKRVRLFGSPARSGRSSFRASSRWSSPSRAAEI